MTKSFKQPDVFNEQATKSFKWPDVFNKRVTKSFEPFDVSNEGVTKLFEGIDVSGDQATKGDQAIWMVEKRLVNGKLFENGKPLAYIFQCFSKWYYFNNI